MVDSPSHETDDDVFDIQRLRQLVELMKEHDLSEVDLRQAPRRIRLRRGAVSPTMMGLPALPAAVAAGVPTSSTGPAPSAKLTEEANVQMIRSPMVGTFYAKPNPDSPPFVKVGDVINPDTVVCVIEAMKTFNEIPAGVSGRIIAVLVDNEEPVDVNKPLFKVAQE